MSGDKTSLPARLVHQSHQTLNILDLQPVQHRFQRWRQWSRAPLVMGLLTLLLIILFGSYSMLREQVPKSENSVQETELANKTIKCHKPSLRKEWRTLSRSEQVTYTTAVKCLMYSPSIFHADTSFYDDFVFAHSKTGSFSQFFTLCSGILAMASNVYTCLRTSITYKM